MKRDQNGHIIYPDIRRDVGTPGWGVTVTFGGAMGPATEVRRYYYRTRKQARNGDIGDDIGRRGRVA